ncbi:hypothetical protein GH733_007250 [Mirounga leonina]|nr:hypothetical protein GH733_007250 [Mirounga leonina]
MKDPVPSGFSVGEVLIPLADEYDPVFPNDYEKVEEVQDLAPSLPKLLFLPQYTRNKTDPDVRMDLATPSLTTWLAPKIMQK